MTHRVALAIEYQGAAFEGWQSQPHGRTVQDALQKALAEIAQHPVSLACAGRTDTGVHATTQVAHFDTTAVRPLSAWVRGVNAHLPESICVRWAHSVDAGFHARFSARSRSYRYLLLNRPVRPAILVGRVGWLHAPLALEAMQAACAVLIGEQDFSAFRAAECQAHSPVRVLRHAAVQQLEDFFVFDFSANGFLHHMVRNLVGALVFIGRGNAPATYMAQLLAQRDRRLAPPTFSADGLYLCGIDYPDWPQLPQNGALFVPPILLSA